MNSTLVHVKIGRFCHILKSCVIHKDHLHHASACDAETNCSTLKRMRFRTHPLKCIWILQWLQNAIHKVWVTSSVRGLSAEKVQRLRLHQETRSIFFGHKLLEHDAWLSSLLCRRNLRSNEGSIHHSPAFLIHHVSGPSFASVAVVAIRADRCVTQCEHAVASEQHSRVCMNNRPPTCDLNKSGTALLYHKSRVRTLNMIYLFIKISQQRGMSQRGPVKSSEVTLGKNLGSHKTYWMFHVHWHLRKEHINRSTWKICVHLSCVLPKRPTKQEYLPPPPRLWMNPHFHVIPARTQDSSWTPKDFTRMSTRLASKHQPRALLPECDSLHNSAKQLGVLVWNNPGWFGLKGTFGQFWNSLAPRLLCPWLKITPPPRRKQLYTHAHTHIHTHTHTHTHTHISRGPPKCCTHATPMSSRFPRVTFFQMGDPHWRKGSPYRSHGPSTDHERNQVASVAVVQSISRSSAISSRHYRHAIIRFETWDSRCAHLMSFRASTAATIDWQ